MVYIDADGKEKRPIVVHRSSVGCIERTIAFLLEKYAGALPLWLSPVQLRLLPVNEQSAAYADELALRMKRRRLRVEVDSRSETVGRRLLAWRKDLVPYLGVVGSREETDGTVSVTSRDTGKKSVVDGEELVDMLCRDRDERRIELSL